MLGLLLSGLACGPLLWTSLLMSCDLHLELWIVELWSWPGDCSPGALFFYCFTGLHSHAGRRSRGFWPAPMHLESLVMYACMVSCYLISLVADCFALVGLLGVLAVE